MTNSERPQDAFVEPEGWGETRRPQGQASLELRAIWNIFWRRKWVLIVFLLLGGGVGQLYLKQQVPVFTATAEVMLAGPQENVVNLRDVVEGLNDRDRNLASNEQRVITSQRLIERLVDRLRLDRDPEFNGTQGPRQGLLSGLGGAISEVLEAGVLRDLVTAEPPAPVIDKHAELERQRLALIDRFRGNLAVRGVPRTRAIAISFTSEDPAKAALIANTLASLYIVDQLETKFEATRRASSWLSRRIAGLRNKVEGSEAAVEDFKAQQAIGTGQGVVITNQQIAELNSQLVAARAARAEAEARFTQVQSRADTGGLGAAATVVDSALILTLRTNLSELKRREAELSQTYGDRHPNMINIRAEIQDARTAIAAEVRKIIEGLRNDVAVARARERTLERSVAELEDRSVTLAQSSVELRQLEREAAADRLIYENFLNRFRETTEQEDLQTADARLLSRAMPPLTPGAPERRKIMVFALAGGGALGLMLILVLEMLANTFRAVTEVTARTGQPVLAALPVPGGGRRRRGKLLDYLRTKPNSALAEAVRTLRTALFLTNIDRPPRVVMVTSSVPGEGKSTTALLLAHMSAQMNKTAIVVDCDIRRPTLHRTFGVTRETGLLSVLDGSCPLEDAVVVDPQSGLNVLPTIEAIPQAADVLSSTRFRQLVETLRAQYDLVILDTPPVLVVSDGGAIGKLADTTLYTVRWNHTPREAVAQGLEVLGDLGVAVAGCVMTLVDRREEARFAYANYGSGYGYLAGKDRYYVN